MRNRGTPSPRSDAERGSPAAATTAANLAFVALLGAAACVPGEPMPEPDPPLDPVERTAALYWAVREAESLARASSGDALARYAPHGVFLGGDAYTPELDGASDASRDAAGDAAAGAAALLTQVSVEQGLSLSVGVEIPGLPEGAPADVCFDPALPESDPFLGARADALRDWLLLAPDVRELSVQLAAQPAPWDVGCSCTACDANDEASLARRANVVWDGLAAAAADRGILPWWWERPAEPETPEAAARLDLALSAVPALRAPPIRTPPGRGGSHPWAPESPRLLDGLDRRVAADLDATAADWGPSAIPRLFPDHILDRVKRHRELGVVAWFASLDGAAGPALGTAQEGNLRFLERAFRDLDASPEDLLAVWVQERYGLDPASEEGLALAAALRASGDALARATHPLGIAISGLVDGSWQAPVLGFLDPTPFDPAWSQRAAALDAPDVSVLVQAHQWGAEATALADAADASLALAAPGIDPADLAELAPAFALLSLTARAARTRVDAELTLRAISSGVDVDGAPLGAWLHGDIETLEGIADLVEAGRADGTLPADTAPLDEGHLRATAAALSIGTDGAPAAERPFPVITEIRWDFADSRTNIYWEFDPSGSGWVESGGSWPAYEDSTQHGPGPAAHWHAWLDSIPPGTRLAFRPCGEAAGYTVCASDHLLWTPE
jgi:hypothetical protein